MTTEPLTLLLAGRNAAPRKELMQNLLTTPWNILTWSEDEDYSRFIELAPQADVAVAGSIDCPWPKSPKLKLRHVPSTGINWVTPEDMPKGCIVCNTFGHEIAIAEFILAYMLESAIGLSKLDRKFRKQYWADYNPGIGPNHLELHSKTVGIVGYGHIGREVAARCKAFGMNIIATSRTVYPAPELSWFGGMDELDKLLSESDYVVMTLPLADETKGMMNAQKFALMKSDAVFINVGRGLVVDEEALYNSLVEDRIRGAAIDVWYQYPNADNKNPTPSKYPFEQLDNVIMTPHCSGSTDAMRERRWTVIAKNLDNFARGEPLDNVCFQGTREDG